MRFLKHSILKYSMIMALLMAQVCCVFNANAQQLKDTLEEVRIKSKRKIAQDDRVNSFSPGQKIITIDSTTLQQYKMQNVANLLSQQTPVFIKSYGLNGLATLNFRGSSAAQSQVYWNGIPIQNAALGIADISLLPLAMLQNVQIVYGSSAALWGSGNVGGALILETDPPAFKKQKPSYEIGFGAGSFNQYQLAEKLGISNSKWSFNANLFAQSAQNNFAYKDIYGEQKKSENAQLQGIAIQPQLAFKPNAKNTFRFVAWYQKYYREIPAALFESYSVKNRNDEALRMLLEWKRTGLSFSNYIRGAFTKEKMSYDDEAATQHYKNDSYQYYFEAGVKKFYLKRHEFLVFTPIQISSTQIKDSNFIQSKYALVAAYRYSDLQQKFIASLNARAEIIDATTVFLPGVNMRYTFSDQFQLRGNVQKTYRAPTLNELYYQPGGNVNLRPEKGWTEEIGYQLSIPVFDKVNFAQDVSVFNRVVDDWILWLGGAVWTPHNIASVHSRGLEADNHLIYKLNKRVKFNISYKASYTVATTVKSYIPNDGSIGKQIPYTPKFTSIFNLGFCYKSFVVNCNYAYTGLRFVNNDESDKIDGYGISNVQMSYVLPIKQKNIGLNFQVNNLFGKDYNIVKSRPMPRINWQFGIYLKSF